MPTTKSKGKGTTTTAMEEFGSLVKSRHEYARAWKARTGRPVVGYLCTYFPEELAYAAGVLPVRVFGSHEPQDVTEPYIYGMYCPFCRDVLAQGLKGRYDYLDALVWAQSCLHMEQAFDSWQLHVPTPHIYLFAMPMKVQSPSAKNFLVQELAAFKKELEGWTGKAITDADLDRAIELCNTSRRLLRQIYETRKSDAPPLSGAEAMEITLSSMLTDKEEHNQLLSHAMNELSQRPGRSAGVRLMLVGSENDDIEFVNMVESLGATVVIDDHCTGSRYFWNEVITQPDRLQAIAQRYLDRPPCPVRDWEERRRWGHILKLANDYRIQGVILIQQKFCDPHESYLPLLANLLKEHHIPTLFLEFDVTIPHGQFTNRVEAFLEMIRSE